MPGDILSGRSICVQNQPFRTSAVWRHVKDIPESLFRCEDNLCFFVGQCLCGQCTCHPPGDTRIQGKNCECDDRQCENMSGEVCGGESASASTTHTRTHIPAHTHARAHTRSQFLLPKISIKVGMESIQQKKKETSGCASLSLYFHLRLMNFLVHSTSLGFTELHPEVSW